MTDPQGNREARSYRRVYAGLVLTMVFWGSAFVASKMIVFDVPPEVGAVLRFGLGALLMMGVLFRRSAQPVPQRSAWGRTAAVGLIGVAAFNTAFFRGLDLAPASDAAMIIPTLSPVFTAAAGILFLGEPARPRRVSGLVVSVLGAVLFFWGVLAHPTGASTRVWGDVLLVGAAACWAAYSIVSRPLLMRIGALPATAWSMVLGSSVLLLLSAPKLAAVPWTRLSVSFWVVLAYLAVFPTVIAYLLWMEGIRAIGSGPATSFMFLAPVSALILAALLLGERPTPLQGIGGAVMLFGVWWINRRERS
jgi:drug/metabolite transporter (DMT)-like permease